MQPVRYAVRALLRNRLFSAAVILTLAIGLGATTAMLTLANTAWLGWSTAYRDADQLTMLQKRFRTGSGLTSPFDFRDWHDGLRSFESLAAYQRTGGRLTTAVEPVMVNIVLSTASFFQVLGVQPALGRFFTRDEESFGRHRVIVLSHATWQNAFGGDRGVIGRMVSLDDTAMEIIGVAPRGTWFGGNPPAVIAPLSFAPNDGRNSRNSHFIFAIGRLRSGVSLAAARAEANVLAARIAQDNVGNEGTGIVIEPLEDIVLSDVKPTLRLVLWAVVLLLVIACANVANLMLVRGAARFREMAVRSALGASGGRIIRQLLTESVVLAIAGGVLGAAIAQVILRVVGTTLPVSLPRVAENGLSLDWRIGLLSLLLVLACGVLVGILPGVQLARVASRGRNADALREGSRGATGGRRSAIARSSLVVSQVSVGMVLLVVAGLFTRTLVELQRADTGVRDSDAALSTFLPLPTARTLDSAAHARFFDDALRRVRAIPGVTSAGVSSHLPLSGGGESKSFWIEGKEPATNAEVASVVGRMESAGSREALGLTMARGRWFADSDRGGAPNVAVISEGVARRFFPDSDPIGQRIVLHRPEALQPDRVPPGGRYPRWTVIGVVKDVKYASPREEPESAVYVHYPQGLQWWTWGPRWLVVRSAVDPMTIAASMRGALRAMDPTLPLTTLLPLDERMALSLRAPRFTTSLVTVFALVAVVMGALGLYGVIAYTVSQDTRALGVRLAVGATSGAVSRHVLARGARLGALGIALGIVGAFGASRLIAAQLFGVMPLDPLTFASAGALLFGLTLLASYVPARRAGRLDPLVALRSE
jgi:putative ABC transport system permease protein